MIKVTINKNMSNHILCCEPWTCIGIIVNSSWICNTSSWVHVVNSVSQLKQL